MLVVDAYHGDWQLQLHTSSPASQSWRIVRPEQPEMRELVRAQQCLMQHQVADYQWLCAVSDGLWMLQREQQQWWLTFWSSTVDHTTKHWLGHPLSVQHTELYELAVIDSRYSAQQIVDYSRFKWGQRQPLLREIGHGQFHIQLQQPLEDLFILQLSGSSLLLQFRQRTSTSRSGND
ncbi:MAG: Uncharacterised protein [Pseudidiomarina mangrovi]|nr:MAG: Uncharacterised protein [Pseudidiomarina mangrovi]